MGFFSLAASFAAAVDAGTPSVPSVPGRWSFLAGRIPVFSKPHAKTGSKQCHLRVRDPKNSKPPAHVLLLLERDTEWKWNDMPVNMSDSLIATQGQDVHALGAHFPTHSLRDLIHDPL